MGFRILQIAPQVPYPLSDGGKVGIYNITKHLAVRGHTITFVAFDRDRGVDPAPLKEYCRLITVRRSTKNSMAGVALNIFSTMPYNISKYQSRKLARLLRRIVSENSFDVVHVDHLHMARYGLLCKQMAHLPIVLREHNVESTIMERFSHTVSSFFMKRYLQIQVDRIRRYESEMASRFDLCCVITKPDQQRLSTLQPSVHTRVIPAGVDSAYFADHSPAEKTAWSMVFFGGFDWLPNRDAVQWFVSDILPKILSRNAASRLYIVGKEIPPSIHELESNNVVIRGFAPDLKKEVQQYQVSIAPFRIGGGIRLKILESFAMRVPVISTSAGCEGIEARHNEHLLIGDTDDEFAECVVRLLENTDLRERISRNAFQLVSSHYRWETVAEQFENAYDHVMAKSARRRPS